MLSSLYDSDVEEIDRSFRPTRGRAPTPAPIGTGSVGVSSISIVISEDLVKSLGDGPKTQGQKGKTAVSTRSDKMDLGKVTEKLAQLSATDQGDLDMSTLAEGSLRIMMMAAEMDRAAKKRKVGPDFSIPSLLNPDEDLEGTPWSFRRQRHQEENPAEGHRAGAILREPREPPANPFSHPHHGEGGPPSPN